MSGPFSRVNRTDTDNLLIPHLGLLIDPPPIWCGCAQRVRRKPHYIYLFSSPVGFGEETTSRSFSAAASPAMTETA